MFESRDKEYKYRVDDIKRKKIYDIYYQINDILVSYLDSFSDLSSTVTTGTDLHAEISCKICFAKPSFSMWI